MYLWISKEVVADPSGSAKKQLGKADLDVYCYALLTVFSASNAGKLENITHDSTVILD
jgi:hypothetical protein